MRIKITDAHLIGPKDTLVLRSSSYPISQKQADELKSSIAKIIPNPVLILGAGWGLEVVEGTHHEA